MNVYDEKKNFVEHELLKLFQKISPDVLNLHYEHHKNGVESVTVTYLLADASQCKRIMSVTANDLRSLALEVLMYI